MTCANVHRGQGIGDGDAKALLWFNKALAIDPSHVPSRYHAGLMNHRLGRYNDAVEAFTAVLSLVRHDKLVYESRGLVFQDLSPSKCRHFCAWVGAPCGG